VARHTDGMLLLVPADPLRPRRPDEHFAAEAGAAKNSGVDVALIVHDALADPGGAERAVARVPNACGMAIYRGWMLRADQYAALAAAPEARDVTLRTSAAQYRRAHELPGWHAALSPVTPPDVLRDQVVQPGAAREGPRRDQSSVRHVGRQRVVCLLTQLWL
jgi:hypothetical protein